MEEFLALDEYQKLFYQASMENAIEERNERLMQIISTVAKMLGGG